MVLKIAILTTHLSAVHEVTARSHNPQDKYSDKINFSLRMSPRRDDATNCRSGMPLFASLSSLLRKPLLPPISSIKESLKNRENYFVTLLTN